MVTQTELVFPNRHGGSREGAERKLGSPRQARNAIAYVINNWRRHDEDRGSFAATDKFSSGPVFDGWLEVRGFVLPAGYEPLPVAAPRSWLLRVGWRKHPLISV